jgi:DNA-binding LacI/PurR family transcriptional regulator
MQEKTPATQQQIAERAGVSRMTVSLALRNHPSLPRETRERIQAIAKQLGYRPNPLISTLMAHLRAAHRPKFQANLAFITSFPTRDGWLYPTYKQFYNGARDRAVQLGYGLEITWSREHGITSKRLTHILVARGISGLVIAPLPAASGHLSLDWSKFSVAALGYSLARPNMHRAVNHQYHSMLLALRKLRHLGYRRIGLAMSAGHDQRADHNWSAGYLVFGSHLPKTDRVPMLLPPKLNAANFAPWFKKHQPDALVSQELFAMTLAQQLGCRVPDTLGFAHLDWATSDVPVAGINQHSEAIGAAAVDLVVAQLQRNERGLPARPRVLLVEGEWVDGPTATNRDAAAHTRTSQAPVKTKSARGR